VNPFQLILQANASTWEYYTKRRQVVKGESGGIVADVDKADKGRVYINKGQYFEGVRQEVWEFHIGGYQVCEKWLKYRRGRELSYDDIQHYQKIVVALGETVRLMKRRCLVEMFD